MTKKELIHFTNVPNFSFRDMFLYKSFQNEGKDRENRVRCLKMGSPKNKLEVICKYVFIRYINIQI